MYTSETPQYGMIQIEPTSRCNMRCITCLRSSHPKLWLERDFSPTLFSKLQGELKNTKAVHLQGWGEPLLLDHLITFIKIASQADCRVSFTSNGSLMGEKLATRLVLSGLDGITFSMAGGTAATQNQIRGKQSFQRLNSTLLTLATVKKKLCSPTPVIAVSYLLTPTTINELPQAISWCGKRGVALVAGIHLTHAANNTQQDLRLFPLTDIKIRRVIKLARLRALFAGVRLEMPLFEPTLIPFCSKDPIRNLSISADGSVAPCVFLNAPVSESIIWLNNEHIAGFTPFTFGNINKQSLSEIWHGEEYTRFRQCYARREKKYQKELAKVGYDLDGIEQLEKAI